MSTEREEVRGTISNTICNASNYPPKAVPYLLGGDMSEVLDRTADAILAAGYRKLEPVWAEGLLNDGEYEYTISSDCDGSNVKHWKRRPEMVATQKYTAWEPK